MFAGPQGLPSACLYRLWDCVFAEGVKVLFRAVLVVIKRAKLEKGGEIEGAVSRIKDVVAGAVDHNEFLKEAFSLRRFSRDDLHSIRKKHYDAISDDSGGYG